MFWKKPPPKDQSVALKINEEPIIICADDANKYTDQAKTELIKKQLDELFKSIKTQIKSGSYETYVRHIYPENADSLKSLGYNIKLPADGTMYSMDRYITINWKHQNDDMLEK